MKTITTLLCCLAFAVAGISLAISEKDTVGYKTSTVSAATIPTYSFPKLPLSIQSTLDKEHTEKKDTAYIDNYVVLQPKKEIRYKTKYLPAPIPTSTVENEPMPDTPVSVVEPIAFPDVGVVREEQTTDNIGPPKESIILIVDGEEVYKR